MEKKEKKVRKRRVKREQSGIQHVAFRGNNRNVVFLDDLDRIKFLEFLNEELKKTDSRLMEICFMTNHCHLMVKTECITRLMRIVLHRYSFWHNKRYGESGCLFSSPFISYPKVTEENLLYNCAYILRNPLAAGMSDGVCDNKWSSIHVHFGCRDVVKTRMLKYVDIDTSLVDSKFKNKEEFISYISNIPSGLLEKYRNRKSAWNRVPFQVLMKDAQEYIDKHFSGKKLGELTLKESDELAVFLFRHTGGAFSQIASLVKDTRYRIRKICCGTTLKK